MDDMSRLVWTMAFMLRDLVKHGAVDLSKLPEAERLKFGVMFSVMEQKLSEVEDD